MGFQIFDKGSNDGFIATFTGKQQTLLNQVVKEADVIVPTA